MMASRFTQTFGAWAWLLALAACNPGSKPSTEAKASAEAKARETEQPPSIAPAPPEDDGESGSALRDKGLTALRGQEFLGASLFFGQACDKGDLSACNELAKLLDEGRGVTADPDRARDLWKQACAAGMQQACDQLGH